MKILRFGIIGLCMFLFFVQAAYADVNRDIDIYDVSWAKGRIGKVSKKDREAASEIIKKALRVVNYDDPKSIIPMFEDAIRIYPRPAFYFFLGETYRKAKEYHKALVTFFITDSIGYRKKGLLYYKTACAASMLKDKKTTMEYLNKAVKNNYSNFEEFKRENSLSFVKTSKEFSEFLKMNDFSSKGAE